jgi:PKD repeat protein
MPPTSTYQNPSVAYAVAGEYDVSLTVSDGTDSQTFIAENYIHVQSAPDAPGIPAGPENTTSLPEWTDDYVTDPVPGALGYSWTLIPEEAGVIIENGAACTIDWTDFWEGEAGLQVKALNDCGESQLSEPLMITVVITGIETINNDDLFISPNPSFGIFNIRFNPSITGPVEVRIVNSLGVEVYKQTVQDAVDFALRLDLTSLEKGVYIAFVCHEGEKLMKKLIIQ